MPDDGLYHRYVSLKADNPAAVAAGKVPPSEWNHRHVVVGAPGAVLFNLGGEVGASDSLTFGAETSILSLRADTLELQLQILGGFGPIIQAFNDGAPGDMAMGAASISLSGATNIIIYGEYGVDVRSNGSVQLTSGDDAYTGILGPLVLSGRASAARITLIDGGGSGSVVQLQADATALLAVQSMHAVPGEYTVANSAIFVRNAAGEEIFRVWGTDPNTDTNYNSGNLYIGLRAGAAQPTDNDSAAYYNMGIGVEALAGLTTGTDNLALGLWSLTTATTAEGNVAVGEYTLHDLTDGYANTAVGNFTLALCNGSENVAVGASAGIPRATTRRQGRGRAARFIADTDSVLDTQLVLLGVHTGRDGSLPYTTALSNAIALGYNARFAASNTAVIGNEDVTDVYFGSTAGLAAIHAKHLVLDGALFAPVSPGGATTQVQYNKAGAFAGDAGLTYNDATDTLTAGVLTATSKVALPNGTIAAPGLAFAADPAVGWYRNAANQWTFVSGGTEYVSVLGSIIRSAQSTIICWTPGQSTVAADTGLSRSAAGVVEVNNGTPGQYRDVLVRRVNFGGTATTDAALRGTSGSPAHIDAIIGDASNWANLRCRDLVLINGNVFGVGGTNLSVGGVTAGVVEINNGNNGVYRDLIARVVNVGGTDAAIKRVAAGSFEFNDGVGANFVFRLNAASNFFETIYQGVVRGMCGNGLRMGNDGFMVWANGTALAAVDTGIWRNTAGVVEINNGTAGQYRDLRARNLIADATSGTVTHTFAGDLTTGLAWNSAGIVEGRAAGGRPFYWASTYFQIDTGGSAGLRLNTQEVVARSDCVYSWNATAIVGGTRDLGLARNTAGVLEINNGTAGQYRDLIVRNLLPTGGVGLPSGTAAAPSLFFSADPIAGWWRNAANQWSYTIGGTSRYSLIDNCFRMGNNSSVAWTSGISSELSADVALKRFAANVLEASDGAGGPFTVRMNLSASQAAFDAYYAGGLRARFGLYGLFLANSCQIAWGSANDATGGFDAGLFRNTAGVVEINNGTPGTLRDLKCRNLLPTLPTAVTGLPTGALWNNAGVVNVAP